MKPTQEQVIAWALKCGARVKSDCQGSGAYGDGVDLNALAALAYEAGRKDEKAAHIGLLRQLIDADLLASNPEPLKRREQ